MASEHAKPVRLQVNTNGAWKDVIRFDAASETVSAGVMDAAARLGRADPSAKFRVSMTTPEGQVLTLSRWSMDDGWKAAQHA